MFFQSLAGETTPAATAAVSAAAAAEDVDKGGKEVLIPDTMGMEQLEAGRGGKGPLPLEIVDDARVEKERCVCAIVVGWVGMWKEFGRGAERGSGGALFVCALSHPIRLNRTVHERLVMSHTQEKKRTIHQPTTNTHTYM